MNTTARMIIVLILFVQLLLSGWIFVESSYFLFSSPPRDVIGNDQELYFTVVVLFIRIILLITMSLQFYRMPVLSGSWHSLSTAILVAFVVTALGAVIVGYAQIYKDFGLVENDPSNPERSPVAALYFSLVTWTTLGYGDLRPTPALRLIAASEGVIGYIGMAAIIAVFGRWFNWLAERKPILPPRIVNWFSGTNNTPPIATRMAVQPDQVGGQS